MIGIVYSIHSRLSYNLAILLALVWCTQGYGQVSGIVTDGHQTPLANVTIFDLQQHHVVFTNEQGAFTLPLAEGKHTLEVQLIGYKQKSIAIEVPSSKELVITLEEEAYQLSEIVIGKSKIDMAREIMSRAIEARDNNKNKIKTLSTDLYIKSKLFMQKTPKKVLGRETGSMAGILDTNGQGILYLSESFSKLYYKQPKDWKEELVYSKVAGDDRGISINQYNLGRFNFYDEEIAFARNLVSPLADAAFQFYNVAYHGSFFDERQHKIHKIGLTPKLDTRPCFKGSIFINDADYSIHSVDLKLSGSSIKSGVIDTIRIQQQFTLSPEGIWYLVSQSNAFSVKLLGFEALYNVNFLFGQTKLNQDLSPSLFSNEIFTAEKAAIKNDSAFWTTQRPIALTNDEQKDYIRKDSLKILWESKPYLDSLDRKNNAFNAFDILLGYQYSNSYQKFYVKVPPILTSTHFNAVEGFTLTANPSIHKYWEENDKRLTINTYLKYGFSDKRLKYWASVAYNYDPLNLGKWELSLGRRNDQLDPRGNISNITNDIESLWYKNHYQKVYDHTFVSFEHDREIANGLLLNSSLTWNKRRALANSTKYSFRHKAEEFEANNSSYINTQHPDINSEGLILSLRMSYSIGQKYMTYPTRKLRTASSWPTLSMQIDVAAPLGDTWLNYSKIKLAIKESKLRLKTYGYSSYNIEYGQFLGSKNFNFLDYFHFLGNNLGVDFESNYPNKYKLQPYYAFSSPNRYLSTFYEHHFDGLVFDRIPILKRFGISGIVSASHLYQKDFQYLELGYGLEGFKIGPIKLGRLDYFWGFKDGKFFDRKLVFGFSAFFEELTR